MQCWWYSMKYFSQTGGVFLSCIPTYTYIYVHITQQVMYGFPLMRIQNAFTCIYTYPLDDSICYDVDDDGENNDMT